MSEFVNLPADTNQARGIAQYAVDFLAGKFSPGPGEEVWRRLEQFHVDSVACGVSALAAGCNAPTVLRREALEYAENKGATCFGSRQRVKAEKAVVANCSAVREWDANGTLFGYDPGRGHTAGEFGHNDYYPVAIAAAQHAGLDGAAALRGMLAIDEIRGRLAEVFSLARHKIDHVLYGAIASSAVYGAMLGATVDQLESAIGSGRGALCAISGHSPRQAIVGFQRRFGRHQHRSCRAQRPARDARLRRTAPTFSATPKLCFACSSHPRSPGPVRSICRWQPAATTLRSWACTSSWGCTSISLPAQFKG